MFTCPLLRNTWFWLMSLTTFHSLVPSGGQQETHISLHMSFEWRACCCSLWHFMTLYDTLWHVMTLYDTLWQNVFKNPTSLVVMNRPMVRQDGTSAGTRLLGELHHLCARILDCASWIGVSPETCYCGLGNSRIWWVFHIFSSILSYLFINFGYMRI